MTDWIIGVILALFVIVPCWLALARRQELERQVNAWPELARRTGLTFDSNVFNSLVKDYYRPGLRGEYRGYSLAMDLFINGDTDRGVLYQNTSISLEVQNHASFSLTVQAKGILDGTHRSAGISSGNPDFDRRFWAAGSPSDYVQEAAGRIVRCDPRLLAWIMRSYPSIELKGERLNCEQNGEIPNVDDQIALLDLLCDLADLAEKMGSKTGRRN